MRCPPIIDSMILWLAAVAAAGFIGCSSEPSTDSETHWQSGALEACRTSADCVDGRSCLCGICTDSCSQNSNDCLVVDTAAVCVTDPQALQQCSSEASNVGGVCAQPCQSNADCTQRDSRLVCRQGYCTRGEASSPQPDGGRDGADGGENTYSCTDAGTCCSAQVEEMIDPQTSQSVGWEVHNGVDIDGRTTLSGTWLGTRTLDQPVAVPCPANADQIGLPCEVDRVASFRRDDDTLIEFRVGVPAAVLEGLPTNVAVEIDHLNYPDSTNTDASHIVAVRRVSDGAILLLLDASGDYSQNQLSLGYPGFTLRMRDGVVDDPSTALCLTSPDTCDRVMRAEPLLVDADTSHELETLETLEFTAGGRTYRAWHAVSTRRYYGDWTQCTDITPAESSVVIALVSGS